MTERDTPNLDAVRDLYERSLTEHGASAKGVGWGSEQAHRLRFQKLAEVIDRSVSDPVSVSDLGCGYGAFLDYLLQKGVGIGRFRGYDISQRMLERATKQHPDHEWIHGSSLDAVTEYAFASGIFNVRMTESDHSWHKHIESTLEDLDTHSTKGFAFNLLSTYVDFQEPHLFYGDPSYFFDLCKRRFSRRVVLLHDYPLYEWTMLVRK